jgi:hypothetical protein
MRPGPATRPIKRPPGHRLAGILECVTSTRMPRSLIEAAQPLSLVASGLRMTCLRKIGARNGRTSRTRRSHSTELMLITPTGAPCCHSQATARLRPTVLPSLAVVCGRSMDSRRSRRTTLTPPQQVRHWTLFYLTQNLRTVGKMAVANDGQICGRCRTIWGTATPSIPGADHVP